MRELSQFVDKLHNLINVIEVERLNWQTLKILELEPSLYWKLERQGM